MADEPFEEASLDDFFQPPTDDDFAKPAPKTTPKQDIARQNAGRNPLPIPVDDGEDDFNAVTDAGFSAADPLAAPASPSGFAAATDEDDVDDFAATLGQDASRPYTPQVEDLPITDRVSTRGGDKKKVLIIAGAAVAVLLLLGVGAMLILGGESEPEPMIVEEDIAIEEPAAIPSTPPPAPDLKVERLGDLDQSPTTRHFAGSKLYDTATGAISEDGKKKLAGLSLPVSLYVGTFVVPKHMEAAKDRVRKAGLKPVVRETRSMVKMHRLHVGNYNSSSAAKSVYRKLIKAGFDAFIIKAGPGNYQVYAGSFFTETKAREYRDRLFSSDSGFLGELTDTRVELPNWTVWAGTYESATAVEAPLEAILKSGIEVDVAAGR